MLEKSVESCWEDAVAGTVCEGASVGEPHASSNEVTSESNKTIVCNLAHDGQSLKLLNAYAFAMLSKIDRNNLSAMAGSASFWYCASTTSPRFWAT